MLQLKSRLSRVSYLCEPVNNNVLKLSSTVNSHIYKGHSHVVVAVNKHNFVWDPYNVYIV